MSCLTQRIVLQRQAYGLLGFVKFSVDVLQATVFYQEINVATPKVIPAGSGPVLFAIIGQQFAGVALQRVLDARHVARA